MRRGIGIPPTLAGVLALILLAAGCGGDDGVRISPRALSPPVYADNPNQAESLILSHLFRAHGREPWYPAINEVQVGRRMTATVSTSLGSGGRRASRRICRAVLEARVVSRTRVNYGGWALVCRG